ncbi:MAG: hypothetical protein JW937_01595 [Candidatus Omnitrophica bacterium]|nr:hypothetical protein [Candidatus Omnitrophota bacterium]
MKNSKLIVVFTLLGAGFAFFFWTSGYFRIWKDAPRPRFEGFLNLQSKAIPESWEKTQLDTISVMLPNDFTKMTSPSDTEGMGSAYFMSRNRGLILRFGPQAPGVPLALTLSTTSADPFTFHEAILRARWEPWLLEHQSQLVLAHAQGKMLYQRLKGKEWRGLKVWSSLGEGSLRYSIYSTKNTRRSADVECVSSNWSAHTELLDQIVSTIQL